jgi:hypothetical protein
MTATVATVAAAAAAISAAAAQQISRLVFNETTFQIYEMVELDALLHLKIGLWHAELIRQGRKPPFQPFYIKRALVPRQSFLKRLNPDNTLSVDEVWDEVLEVYSPL